RVVPHAHGGVVIPSYVVGAHGDGVLGNVPAVLPPARALFARDADVVAGPEVEPRRALEEAVVTGRAREARLDQALRLGEGELVVAPAVQVVEAGEQGGQRERGGARGARVLGRRVRGRPRRTRVARSARRGVDGQSE